MLLANRQMFLILTVFMASVNSMLLHKIPKRASIISFNMICSAVWVAVLFAVNGFSLQLNADVLLWGVLYGVVQMLFLFFKTKAMSSGLVSITTLIGNCSLILSTFVGAFVWQEKISVLQIIAIAVLILSFFCCTYQKSQSKSSKKWVFYCVLFFVFAAGVGIIFKVYSKLHQSGDQTGDMMITAAMVMIILLLVGRIFENRAIKVADASDTKTEETNPEKLWNKNTIFIAILCGLLSCVYNRLNIDLSGMFESAVFYPCFNGGTCLVSAVLSVIFFKERLKPIQVIGLIIGITAVILIGVF